MATTTIQPDTVIIDVTDYVGDTVSVFLNYEDDQGNAADFTGSTASLFVKKTAKAETALLTLTETDGIQLNQITNWNIVWTITDTRSAELGAGNYQYFLVITDSLGFVNTYFAGKLTLLPR